MKHILAPILLLTLLFPSLAFGETVKWNDLVVRDGLYYKKFSADKCDKVIKESIDPKPYEHLNCRDGSLSKIVKTLTDMSVPLLSCLFNKGGILNFDNKNRNFDTYRDKIPKLVGNEVKNFCRSNPNGTFGEFTEFFYGKVLKGIGLQPLSDNEIKEIDEQLKTLGDELNVFEKSFRKFLRTLN